MIEFLSSWAKGLGVTIVIVSILEMLLPNNKTKKYIKMVLGVYVIFNIISPIIQNKEIFNLDELDLSDYQTTETSAIDQTSMDERIEKLYMQELEKDITKKIKEMGYEVTKCKIDAQISDKEEDTKINKIKLKIEKNEENQEEEEKDNSTEDKIVSEIQKIKKIDTTVEIDKNEEKTENEKENKTTVTKVDVQNVKKFLIEEYGVNEKCLEIN
jgi:stage III sporulation protein AF